MSRKPLFPATALLLVALAGGNAQAGIFKRDKADKPAAEAGKTAAATPAEPARRATTEERATAQRLEPLARVAFWSREFNLDPRDAEAGAALSSALRAMGRHEEAAQTAERAVAVTPAHVDSLLELARAHIARNQGFYAIDPLKKAADRAPRDWRVPSLLGVAYEQVGRGPEARLAWEQALKLSPENPSVLANLALSHAAGGDLPTAEGLLRRAAVRKDASIRVRQNLVMVLGLQGKLQEAERLAREDLPPEIATANLAWLRAAAPAAGRSWDALRAAEVKTN